MSQPIIDTQTKAKSPNYPDPLIIQPPSSHKQTFIILHGRGSNALEFGPDFLSTPIPPSTSTSTFPIAPPETSTFRTLFPHTKFIFPTASPRRTSSFNRSLLTQWFDNIPLIHAFSRPEIEIDGLRETSVFIHSLLSTEIAAVGAENVVMGGLSQGCAAVLVAVLMWEGERLGGAFGLCGWLPFCDMLTEIAVPVEWGSDDDEEGGSGGVVFRGEEEEGDSLEPVEQAVKALREELAMEDVGVPSMVFRRTPLFLGHGAEDGIVAVERGRRARECLREMGVRVEWREYDELGHWYSTPMLRDLARFIKEAGSAKEEEVRADKTLIE